MQHANFCPYCGATIWIDIINKENTTVPHECEACGYTSAATIVWTPAVTIEVDPDELKRKVEEEIEGAQYGHTRHS